MILAQAPRADQNVLIAGLAALEAELEWFENNAKKFNLDLNEELRPACKAYVDFLLALRHEPYAVRISSLWAVERAYLDAWRTALPCEPEYREFVERWTTPEFGEYVEKLEAAANRALAAASPDERAAALISFRWVARYEYDFWQMAFGD